MNFKSHSSFFRKFYKVQPCLIEKKKLVPVDEHLEITDEEELGDEISSSSSSSSGEDSEIHLTEQSLADHPLFSTNEKRSRQEAKHRFWLHFCRYNEYQIQNVLNGVQLVATIL